MLGIINLNKPTGKTSHDMVAFVRRLLKMKRIGHAGTLDPCASGVLPILVGKATNLSELLTEKTKTYIASVRLGLETDTYDLTGTVVARCEKRPSPEEIQAVAKAFVGEITQMPPMYSAVKLNGKKLYELARKGISVPRPPRQVRIEQLRCYDFGPEGFQMEVRCSKGTYIRSLCHDLGQSLGTCACMAELVRTQSGPFFLEEACTPDTLAQAVAEGRLEQLLIPPDAVLKEFPAVRVSPEAAVKIKNGIRMRLDQLSIKNAAVGDRFRLYENDALLCLARVAEGEKALVLAIDKGFYESN